MTRTKLVLGVTFLALILFAGAAYLVNQYQASSGNGRDYDMALLEREHSPSLGPESAKVTIVEFFDPACEACRAFYPFVKKIMAQHPGDVRVVLRYTTFHKGSDEVVRLLEAARLQNLFLPVLETVLRRQPEWADHGKPNIALAWEAAEQVGLDIEQARKDGQSAAISQVLKQDMADVRTVGVLKTPTFFVNGKGLETFGGQQLYDLVLSELQAP